MTVKTKMQKIDTRKNRQIFSSLLVDYRVHRLHTMSVLKVHNQYMGACAK